MVLLSITGLFRMFLIILGVIFLIRIIGKFMIAKRNIEDERRHHRDQSDRQRQSDEHRQNSGKTTYSRIDKDQVNRGEYTDYEEIQE